MATYLVRQSDGFGVAAVAASQHHRVAFIAGIQVDDESVETVAADELTKQV